MRRSGKHTAFGFVGSLCIVVSALSIYTSTPANAAGQSIRVQDEEFVSDLQTSLVKFRVGTRAAFLATRDSGSLVMGVNNLKALVWISRLDGGLSADIEKFKALALALDKFPFSTKRPNCDKLAPFVAAVYPGLGATSDSFDFPSYGVPRKGCAFKVSPQSNDRIDIEVSAPGAYAKVSKG
jgi:hypothetical protein